MNGGNECAIDSTPVEPTLTVNNNNAIVITDVTNTDNNSPNNGTATPPEVPTANLIELNVTQEDSFLSNSTTSHSPTSTASPHETSHADHEHLQQRVLVLEKKLTDQSDEIVCLRSTLADVLRRVTQLEGRAPVITSTNVPNTVNNKTLPQRYNSNSQSIYSPNNRSTYNLSYNGTNGVSPMKMQLINGNGTTNGNNAIVTNGHRRLQQCPSNSSIHSERGLNWSNSSPAPSPSPSPSSSIYRTTTPTASPRHTPQRDQRSFSVSTPNLLTMRSNKWSVSQEFRGSSMMMPNHHKEAVYNQEDGIIQLYLRGHPLVMHIPTDLLHSYSINKVNSPPTQRLKLEWVYGYRGRDCRHNLFLLPTGEIVYFIAAVVVLYNVEDQIQRHYSGHTDDIKCLTIHPNKLLIASGQTASLDRRERRPHVLIWDSVSLHTLHVIGQNGDFDRGISCLAFSKLDGGNLLCVVDESNEHSLSLWDWQKSDRGHKITETKTSCDPVLAAEFHPMDRFCLITIGKGHIHFWDIEGGSLSKKLGIFEKQDKPKYMLCMAYNDLGELLTGDSNGNIMFWQRTLNRPIRTIYNAHEGGVFTICILKDGTVMTGGGKDRRIVEWDANLNRTGREAKLPDQFGAVRTLTTGKGSMLIVGTTKNCILQGTLALNFSLVVQGHTDELWALAIHPTQNQFITAGYDRIIHLWDTLSHSVVWSKDLGESVQSSIFSPDGSVLIFTTNSSRWIVIDATTRRLVSMHSDGNERIDCVKFSPDGRFLALGSRDNHIYVYQVSEEYRKYMRIGRCSGHSSFITSIDFTTDGTYMQSTSGDYEHLFWNATTCRQLNNMSIARDLEWHTHNSAIGFHVFGIWPDGADGTDINTCDRSHSQKLLATGDDYGKVNLYSYPSSQPKCLHHTYPGHSSHVSSVRFMADDSRLVSIGGRDSTIMQWTVT